MDKTNLAYYRKYRPQSLNEIIGQTVIKQSLQNAFNLKRLSHAYLFCGPRGTGKTSTARILAKMVNCQGVQSEELRVKNEKDNSALITQNSELLVPCNSCSSCISITDGSNLDLIEIDAASNRGIDDIRELRDTIKLAPTSSIKKVYIIDEVHMLTTEAFNALLKTLEEPPAHALFILATTDPHKIPQTILSRVQRLDFQVASIEDLLQALKNVTTAEKIEIEEEALKLIAKKADGSFRDSLKLLDQLSSNSSKITLKNVEECLKSGDFTAIIEILENISQQNPQKSLKALSDQIEAGINLKDLTLTILDYLRTMLLIKYNSISQPKSEFSEEKFKGLELLSQKFSSEKLINLLSLFITALEKMKFTTIPALPLEIAIVEATQVSIQNLQSTVKPATDQLTHFADSARREADNLEIYSTKDSLTISEAKIEEVVITKPTDDIASTDMIKLADKWTYILETIKPYNYSLEALLRQVKILSCEDGLLLFEVPYSFHQRILEQPKSKDLLESVISDVLSKTIRVKTMLGKRPVKVEELANVELAADDEIVKAAAEIFNSEVN